MYSLSIEGFDELGLNRYEAIIVASQHARYLNNLRIKTLEKMEDNPDLEIESRKMTMCALRDLLSGKVKFARPDSE